MRIVPFIVSAAVTTGLVIALNTQLPVAGSKTPRLGYFLSPQYGFWQNAEPTNTSFDKNTKLPGIKSTTDVYIDDRLVPHVYAENDADAYYVQGYLHAKFRLWQMEFQTYVAAGRLSEIVGEERLSTDQFFRRLGMVYAAEHSLAITEADPVMKEVCDSYTAGVNAYISSLKPNEIPFEYKMMDYKPEPWTNLKTALFLKFMSYDLSGQSNDLLYTNAKNVFGYADYMKLFPDKQDTLDPIIPRGTAFAKPGIKVKMPSNIDSAYFGRKDTFTKKVPIIPNKNNGSNNWAVAGSKTKSGKPILCNDPHLGLNLPSLWYEMQITTPTHNTYGATFPGSPAVIIGFNDSCAWGETNAGRDVKDFYEIQFRDSTMQEYWFNKQWVKSEWRKETIKVKGKPDDVENIAMTVFGPVMYDKNYKSSDKTTKAYALRWSAHDSSNELRTFYYLNRAKNYADYSMAISTFHCPGQNFVFACHNGDIAIKQQGAFVAKWKSQGDFAMPGTDSSYMWQGFIPVEENPQMLNPARGFVSSANQKPVDESYPYYLGKSTAFPPYRGYIINRRLAAMKDITPQDMEALQTDNYNVFAEICRPVLLKYLRQNGLDENSKKYLDIFKNWNLRNDTAEKAPTVFKVWWDDIEHGMWDDEFAQTTLPMPWPDQSVLIESIIKDSTYKFADDITTKDKVENVADIVSAAFKKAVDSLTKIEKDGKLNWSAFKDTHVMHLTKQAALSRLHLPVGGGTHIINATTGDHGPSWRMVVHMTDNVEAYAVYPGGQSGNPGSKYYDTFLDTWVQGKYYSLLFLKKEEATHNNRVKWHISFVKA